VDSLSSFQQYIQIHGISYHLSAVIFGDNTHFCSIACDPIPEGDVNIFYDGIKRRGRHTTFVPFKGSFKKIMGAEYGVTAIWYVKQKSCTVTDFGKLLPECDTGQSALPTEDKSVNWKQSSPNTHGSEQKQSLVLKSLTTKEMYLKAVQEMYPEANMGLLSSNLAIYEDWDNVRAVAALKAFTAVRKMITEKKLVYDNRTSLSDDEDSDGSCASYMQKKPKKTNLDDEDKKFFTSLPTCYSLFFAFDSKDAAHSYCPFSSHNKCWQRKNSLETLLGWYECRNRPFKSNELQQHVAQTHSKSWCGVGLRIFLHELYPSPLTAEKGFASKTSNRKKIKSKNNPFATHASSHFLRLIL
jgi:hypothetical protein